MTKTINSFACYAMFTAVLTACGGGGGGPNPVEPSTGQSGNGNTPPTTAPTTPTTTPPVSETSGASTDLRAFAAVWTGYSMARTVPMIQLMAGATVSCPLGGQTSYDPVAQRQNAVNCISREDPVNTYNGMYSIGGLTVTPDSGIRLARLFNLDVTMTSTVGNTFKIGDGEIGSQVEDTGTGSTFSFSSAALTFTVGMTKYMLSNAAAVLIAIDVVNGKAQRTTTNMAFAMSDGRHTWQMHMPLSVHEIGTDYPDAGSLQIVRIGALQALNATFSADNTFVLEGGEDGKRRTYRWTDTEVQAAIKDARK